MFDNLRDDASSAFYEEDDTELFPEEVEKPAAAAPRRRKTNRKILGMTPVQRFIIAVMLMIAVCTLGTMFLLITERIALI